MKKNINIIILVLLILNASIIYFIFVRSYEKTQTIKLSDNILDEIEISYDVQSNPLSKVEIKDLSNTNAGINSCIGSLGQSIDISGNFFNFQLKEANITMKYDETKLGETKEEDLGILWYDKENEQMEIIETTLNTENNTISFKTTHFSEYIIVNLDEWQSAWHKRVIKVRNESDKFEIAFVIDDSGSMSSNDPQNLRLEATKNFVEMLEEQDKYSITEFEDNANILQELTNDKGKVKDAVEKFKSSGGTNIASGLEKGIENLDNQNETSKVIVLLTDGEDNGLNSKREELIKKAKDKDIIIFTIFLNTGYNTNENDTTDIAKIAKDTYGEFYTINSEEVIDIFNKIRKVSIGTDAKQDSDNDGIPDEIELGGIKNQFGQIIYTNPYSSDTDGDGITDDKEIGTQKTASDGTAYYPMNSDPTSANETNCKYYSLGPNSNRYEVWDSGFKLNKNALRFTNLQIRQNDGTCAGISYLTEKTFNKTKITTKGESKEINDYRRKNRKDTKEIKKSLEGDQLAELIEQPDEVRNLLKNSNQKLEEEEIENSVIMHWKGLQEFDISQDKEITNGLLYFYNIKSTELKNYLYNGNHRTDINYKVLETCKDKELLKALFYYHHIANTNINKEDYKIDYAHPMTKEILENKIGRDIFDNGQIVTIKIVGHQMNGYALEKTSDSEYILYVYENNWPYEFGEKTYIRFVKTIDKNLNEYYTVGYDPVYNNGEKTFLNKDEQFELTIIKDDKIINYEEK